MWSMDTWQNFPGFAGAATAEAQGLAGEVKVEKQENLEVGNALIINT